MLGHSEFLYLELICLIICVACLLAYIIYNRNKSNQIISKYAANEIRLQTILDTAVDAVITINSKGIIQGFNKSAAAIFGWNEDEIVGQNVSLLMPSQHAKKHDGYISNHLKTGRTKIIGSDQEVIGKHKNGSLFPIRLGVGRADIPGQEPLFVGFISDISKRKKLEEDIVKSQKEYISLMSNIPGTTFRAKVETDGFDLLFISEAIADLTGYTPEDFLNGSVYLPELIHPEDAETSMMAVQFAISNTHKYSIEYRVKHRSGGYSWVLDNSSVSRAQEGHIIIDGVLLDVTARRKMLEELNQAKAEAESSAATKAAFLANMSHEIRTPMNSIIGFSDILLSEEMPDEQRKHITTISSSAKSLLHLLNEILDTAKLESGKLELDIRSFNLGQLVDSVISTLWFQAKTKNLTLDFKIDPTLSKHYLGDDNRIRQVLMNLIGNAIKFTEKGGISLTVKALPGEASGALFVIKDTGIGIEQDRLDSIFEPFTQADNSMSRRFGGTGLGTTISRQLVNLMGGEIKAQSIVGLGSQFSFDIPMEHSEDIDTNAVTIHKTLSKKKILAADDVAQNRDLLEILLKRQGHEVILAENGKSAFELFQVERPDIVLMDIQMPVMDGMSATQCIREFEQNSGMKHTPIIALTASVLKQDRFQAENAGMDGFATKPVDIDELTQEMARVLNEEPNEVGNYEADPVNDETKYQLINIVQAETLWGDLRVYQHELALFLERYKTLKIQLKNHISNQQYSELNTCAHMLKGTAGNLSIKELFLQFGRLENAAAEENSVLCEESCARIDLLFDEVFLEFKQLPCDKLSEIEGLKLTDIDFKALVKGLLDAIAIGEINDDALERLKHGTPSNYQEQINKAVHLIDHFKFKEATVVLEIVINEISSMKGIEDDVKA